jgi:hypothetical protein
MNSEEGKGVKEDLELKVCWERRWIFGRVHVRIRVLYMKEVLAFFEPRFWNSAEYYYYGEGMKKCKSGGDMMLGHWSLFIHSFNLQ